VSGVLRACECGWKEHWPLHLAGLPYFSQEATFFSRSIWEKIGKFDERLNYGFDVAFFSLALNSSRCVALTSVAISTMQGYGTQKTDRDDPATGVERNILLNGYSTFGRRSRVVERLNRTRFNRWNKLLLHSLFRKRMSEFLRVEYVCVSSS